jgi:hypothetical protein
VPDCEELLDSFEDVYLETVLSRSQSSPPTLYLAPISITKVHTGCNNKTTGINQGLKTKQIETRKLPSKLPYTPSNFHRLIIDRPYRDLS